MAEWVPVYLYALAGQVTHRARFKPSGPTQTAVGIPVKGQLANARAPKPVVGVVWEGGASRAPLCKLQRPRSPMARLCLALPPQLPPPAHPFDIYQQRHYYY